MEIGFKGGDLREFISAFDMLGFACVLVDSNGRVLIKSDRATQMLNALSGSERTFSESDRRLIRNLVAQASVANGDRALPRPTILTYARGRSIIVHAALVAGDLANAGDGLAAVLLLIDPDETRELSVQFLRSVFGLTESEIALAGYLCTGKNIKEIALLRRTSIATIRVQLRAIFTKTRTRRQAELVALLSRIPPQIPALAIN